MRSAAILQIVGILGYALIFLFQIMEIVPDTRLTNLVTAGFVLLFTASVLYSRQFETGVLRPFNTGAIIFSTVLAIGHIIKALWLR